MRLMNGFLSQTGLLSITLVVIYVIKRINDYCYFRKEEKINFKLDKADDDFE